VYDHAGQVCVRRIARVLARIRLHRILYEQVTDRHVSFFCDHANTTANRIIADHLKHANNQILDKIWVKGSNSASDFKYYSGWFARKRYYSFIHSKRRLTFVFSKLWGNGEKVLDIEFYCNGNYYSKAISIGFKIPKNRDIEIRHINKN